MNKSRFIFSFIIISLLSVQIGFAGGIKFFKGTWEEALAEADRTGKLLFIDAYADWCGPCKYMASDIFPLDEVGEFYNANFISYKIDVDENKGGEIFAGYGGTAMPTYIFVDGQANLVYKQVGAMDADSFIEVGNKALAVPALKASIDNGTASEKEQMDYMMMMGISEYNSEDGQFFFNNLDMMIEEYGEGALNVYIEIFESEYEKAVMTGDTADLVTIINQIDKFEAYLPDDFDTATFKEEVLAELGE